MSSCEGILVSNIREIVPPAGTFDGRGTQSAERVADILTAFLQGQEVLGVTEIATRLGLSKAVVHRVLQSLASRELVRADEHRAGYRLGPAAFALGAHAPREHDLREIALPYLARLRNATRETVTVSALVHTVRVYLDQLESPQEIRMAVELGRPRPLHAGASGKVILAFLDPLLRERVLTGSRLDRVTSATLDDPALLRKELARIRETHLAVSRGERNKNAGSVASAIFGPDGRVLGAVSICGPVERIDDEVIRRSGALVRTTAEEISAVVASEAG